MSFQLDALEDFTSFCRDTGRQTQPMLVTCYILNLHQKNQGHPEAEVAVPEAVADLPVAGVVAAVVAVEAGVVAVVAAEVVAVLCVTVGVTAV